MATKLEQQLDQALRVLASHTKPVRYIVRKPRRAAGKGRAPLFETGPYVLWRHRSDGRWHEVRSYANEDSATYDADTIIGGGGRAKVTFHGERIYPRGTGSRGGKKRAGGGANIPGMIDVRFDNFNRYASWPARDMTEAVEIAKHEGVKATFVLNGAVVGSWSPTTGARVVAGRHHISGKPLSGAGKPRKRRTRKGR